MKFIFALMALVILVLPVFAMPTNLMNDSSVCKMEFDTGSSFIGIFAWHNLATHRWEVKIGATTYEGSIMFPITFTGNDNGIVSIKN